MLICGYGSDKEVEVVAKHCQESQVGTNIHLLGHRFDITNLLAQTQVLVVPSQAYESFGYVVVEAMCSRVPVVVTDVGGLAEVVVPGMTGCVVPPGDSSQLAEVLSRNLPAGFRAMRREVARVKGQYSWGNFTTQLERVLK